MFGWMAQTPLNLLRVQEMIAFLATPGAISTSLATDIGVGAHMTRCLTDWERTGLTVLCGTWCVLANMEVRS